MFFMIDRDFTQKIFTIAKKAALEAGDHARSMREQQKFSVHLKGTRDLVTEADLECEAMILETIRKNFPDHNILSEESPLPDLASLHEGPLWIVDPIDGTTNFAHGQPCVGISIGFAYDGVRQVGVVYCPFLDELYSAVRGNGAYMNAKPISVSGATVAEKSLICTGFPYDREKLTGLLKRLERVVRKFRDLRRLGAASVDICFIANGRLDGFYEDLKPWDAAAGLMIAEEAGAYIGHFSDPYPHTLAWAPDSDIEIPEQLDASNLVVCTPGIAEELQATLSLEGEATTGQ
jgi:myo-inositol-1(or 4)-monophosphatase